MRDNVTRDLAISTAFRVSLTMLLCSLPFMKFGMNAISAAYALLIFVPCSFMLSKPLISWAGVLGAYLIRQPYVKWQGNYYEFSGSQIRICPVDRTLWFVDTDVLCVIGQKSSAHLKTKFDVHEYDVIPSTWQYGFSEEGVEKLLRESGHPESKKMLVWIQREVVKPYRRKLELGLAG
jgi:hypothetical protein